MSLGKKLFMYLGDLSLISPKLLLTFSQEGSAVWRKFFFEVRR